jgi:DUF1016 N-terminal domain
MLGAGLLTALTIQSVSDASRYFPQSYHFFNKNRRIALPIHLFFAYLLASEDTRNSQRGLKDLRRALLFFSFLKKELVGRAGSIVVIFIFLNKNYIVLTKNHHFYLALRLLTPQTLLISYELMLLHQQFDYVFELIENARNKALASANREQIMLYWTIGQFVQGKLATSEWGEGTVTKLSTYLQSKDPKLNNFTKRGIYRMRQFYMAYTDVEIVSALPTQLSWTHNLEILSQTKTSEERLFYLQLTLKENLNYRELRRQLKSSYFERSIVANQLLPPSLDNYLRDVSNIFKDSYIFEFVQLPEKHSEKDLQKALLSFM